ncbi:LINE-1 retrotransposable element ORF2 protein [Cucumis melo var. makuwa]|uniref:LINE-1 retrotransposable element ORF2 protein n=1 Tax=Cucumis melo var. makuwa TaxID=1194695 RepID=A0A5D3DW73_CUCMM|nr:LINE-1 retrotransposable element ORF2 protein [Cucumis melo var. makuwa]
MKSLIETPKQNRFSIEKRFHECCYSVKKTRNKNGYIAEVFGIDQQGRKCCVLVLEGDSTCGWVSFLSMIIPNVETEPKVRHPLDHFFKKRNIATIDSDSDSSRKSYARVVSEGYSSDSSACSEIKKQRSVKLLPLENAVVITRRLFYDDWKVIMNSLKRQTESTFTYHPFNAEKALIIFKDPWNMKSLCSNVGWTSDEKFQNMDTFLQIGNACRGSFEVDKATMNMENLLEAKIKVRYNYCGFIPATIRIKDKNGHSFVVHSVTICSGKWLAERDVKIHDKSDSSPDIIKETQDTDPQKDEAQIANTNGPQEKVLPIASSEDDMMNKEEEDDFKVKLIQWLKDNNLKLATTMIYFPQQMAAKTASDQCPSEWLIEGDFNVIRWREETSPKNPAIFSMNKFNDFILKYNLIDPPLINNKFTWSNLRINQVLSRLDRFLYNSPWEQTFKPHYSKILSRTTPDHFPLALESSEIRWGPSPFQINNFYLNDVESKNNMKNWWFYTTNEGYLSFAFMQRLKQLASKIKVWQNEKFVFSKTQKQAIIDEINAATCTVTRERPLLLIQQNWKEKKLHIGLKEPKTLD